MKAQTCGRASIFNSQFAICILQLVAAILGPEPCGSMLVTGKLNQRARFRSSTFRTNPKRQRGISRR
ncbi:MAG: hypothetical protein K2X38_04380, partial [Gemmataceae bacterium]|nr:hypothetical protein [Gemmataceae bacterium]